MPHYVRHDKGEEGDASHSLGMAYPMSPRGLCPRGLLMGCLAFARHDKGKRHDKRRKVWQKEKGRTKEGMTEEGRGRTLKFPL